MAETLVELVARIVADASELKKGLASAENAVLGTGKAIEKESKSISQSFQEIGKSFTIVGAAITATMTGIVMSFTKTGEELHDLSLKTGVSVKALAGLKYAAEQNGASLGTIEMALRRSSVLMEEFKDGTSTAADAFGKLGLSLSDLESLNPEEQFMKIMSALAGVESQSARAQLAVALFSRSGTDMLPMLSEGADGLKKIMDEQQKLNPWTKAAAELADEFGDSLGKLKESAGGVFVAIGSSLIPSLTKLVDTITGVVAKFTEWSKEHPELVKNISTVALAVGVVTTVIGGLILIVPKLIMAWKAFNIAIKLGGGIVGWIILAIEALVTVGIILWQNWDKVSHFFADIWSNMKNAVLHSVDAILDYLERFVGWIPWFGDKIKDARKSISEMIDEEKISRDMRDVEASAKKMTSTLKEETQKQKDAALNAHNKIMSALEDEYDQKLKVLNAGTEKEVSSIQKRIDALDSVTDAENKKLREKERREREAELKSTILHADSIEDREDAEKELASIVRERLLDNRDAQKESLQKQIEDIRLNAENKKTIMAAELESQMANLAIEEANIKASFDARLTDAAIYQAALESTLKDVNQNVNLNYTTNNKNTKSSVKGLGFGVKPSSIIPRTIGIPEFSSGGIVPGAIGAPTLVMAHGGEEFLGVGGTESSVNITINLGVLPGDDITVRKVARMIKEALSENSRRNSFGQVNQGYFYGRSSV